MLKSCSFVITVLAVATIMLAVPTVLDGQPPQCDPVPFQPAAIAYTGPVSGCHGPGGNALPCINGETISFLAGTGLDVCPGHEFTWQFEDVPVSAGPTTTHQFSHPGVYLVTVTIIGGTGTFSFSQHVTIADASTIPALGGAASALLLMVLVVLAVSRLR